MRKEKRDRVSEIGLFLRRMRQGKGLSCNAVSRKADVDTSQLSRFETGDRVPTIALLHGLAEGYQMSPDEQAQFAFLVLGISLDPAGVHTTAVAEPWRKVLFDILGLSENNQKRLLESLGLLSQVENLLKNKLG